MPSLDQLGATLDAGTLDSSDVEAASPRPLDYLAPGAELGAFRIKRLIGEGGMGLVYLARDTSLGRPVALKIIRPERLGSRRVERFMHEAKTTARFNHPNIVTVYAVGERGGVPWVALEYLEGDTLRERLDEARPGPRETSRLLLPVARALEEAHKHGVLHRDLKPSNIMIPRDGRVRVVDFGLAKAIVEPSDEAASEGPLTNTASRAGALVGTPQYMAPEQLNRGDVSTAADMWSLGVLLFEMLAGHRPFASAEVSLRTLRQAVVEEAAPQLPADLAIPRELEGLLEGCLSKRQADRPSATDAVQALERVRGSGRSLERRAGPTGAQHAVYEPARAPLSELQHGLSVRARPVIAGGRFSVADGPLVSTVAINTYCPNGHTDQRTGRADESL